MDFDDVEDIEVLQSEVIDAYPVSASKVFQKEIMNYYPFLKTENGEVVEWWGEIGEKRILEILREVWEGVEEADHDKEPWDEVENDLMFSYFDKYGNKVVYQAVK